MKGFNYCGWKKDLERIFVMGSQARVYIPIRLVATKMLYLSLWILSFLWICESMFILEDHLWYRPCDFLKKVSGTIRWKRTDSQWRVHPNDLIVMGCNIKGCLDLVLVFKDWCLKQNKPQKTNYPFTLRTNFKSSYQLGWGKSPNRMTKLMHSRWCKQHFPNRFLLSHRENDLKHSTTI